MVFLPLLHGGRVSERSLGVSTLQAAAPSYSVNNGPINLKNIGKWRVIYKLEPCISNFNDRQKLYGFMEIKWLAPTPHNLLHFLLNEYD